MSELLLTGPNQAETAVWVAVFGLLSVILGTLMRRPGLEGAAFGLLLLTAAADLALFVCQGLRLPVGWHLPLTAVAVVPLVAVLRFWVLPPAEERARPSSWELLSLLGVALAFWGVRIIQVEPSTGLSSQLGWTPLYMRTSFEAGRFLLPNDLPFGVGPVDSLFYAVDMSGVVALAGGFGGTAFYTPYLATSILACGLAILVLLDALRGHGLAQVFYVVLVGALLAVDQLVQAGLGRHWGDNVIILGGALILRMLSMARRPVDGLVHGAAIAAFMVLGRHYGALFGAAFLMAGGVVALRQPPGKRLVIWRALVVTGVVLGVLCLREVWYFLHPTPYYPGSKQLTMMQHDWWFQYGGILHDWGVFTEGRFSLFGPRGLWVFALVGVLVLFRSRLREPGRAWAILAPLAVLALPILLQLLTGYRSSGKLNKASLVTVLFGAYYPALALTWVCQGDSFRRWGSIALKTCVSGAAAGVVLWAAIGPVLGFAPTRAVRWAADLYNERIVDRGIAHALTASGDAERVAAQPLMYFYCEPGMGLRNYLGGTLTSDLDFWGKRVQDRIATAPDLATLLADLGWPNLYLSSTHDYDDYAGESWRKYQTELDNIESQPWVERVVHFNAARLVIVRRPG